MSPKVKKSKNNGFSKEALEDLSLSINPIKFAQKLGFSELDRWQRDLLLSNDKRIILNTCRQSGKTSMSAIIALHTALFRPKSLILIVSPSLRQSGEMFKKITAFYDSIGRPVKPKQETALTLTLKNGSRIVSLPGTEGTTRGFSKVDLICIDEAARCPDEVYISVRPMLAVSEGRLILLSTPYGKMGFFYEVWQHGEKWRRFKIDAYSCPRISEEFLENERHAMSKWHFSSEYLCSFEENEMSFFDTDEIRASLDVNVLPLML